MATGRILKEYQIVYITKGAGSFESEGRRHRVEAGSVLFLFPGVRHVYKPDFEIGWTEYWVGCKGAYADNLVAQNFISPARPVMHIGLDNRILDLFARILDLVRDQEPLYQIRAGSLILALVAEILSRVRKASQSSHSERLVQKVKFHMEENIYGEINIPGICEALKVSPSHLNEVFKSYTAMTPYQYFISIKLQKAKEMLEGGESIIKAIAYRLGFKDEYYFSRLFKRKTGVSPSKWNASLTEHGAAVHGYNAIADLIDDVRDGA
ncbi:MAG TPA: AraC family transcriptional regulator [Rectinemataceae bacterium]|nr:AraC family transcriptional regulator [Rectinemataceae bacterium]